MGPIIPLFTYIPFGEGCFGIQLTYKFLTERRTKYKLIN